MKRFILILLLLLSVPSHARAADTGPRTPGSVAAITSSAGDNNGFETTYGTATPKDVTTANAAGIESLNSGTVASSSCSLPNTSSDQEDFYNFGISLPAGAVVTGISATTTGRYDSNSGTNTFCIFLSSDNGSTWTAGKNTPDISSSNTTNTLGGAADMWGRAGWTNTELDNSHFRLRLMTLVGSTSRDAFLDYLSVTVTYNSPPNTPVLIVPTSGETNVSLTPTFTLVSSDPEIDNIAYTIQLFDSSSCTSPLSTFDQTVSQTGWASATSSCPHLSPPNCYGSGMQANYLTQTSLSAGTQYWWNAKAIDPEGSGNFGTTSTCNSFTTLSAAVSITITSDGSIAYGYIGSGVAKNTTANGINDTQVVKNDGTVPEDLTIKTTAATGGTSWSLGSSAGANTFVHEFSTNSGGAWTQFATADSYQALITNLAAGSSQNLDFRLTGPTSSSDYQQKAITVTILATAH